MMRGKERMLKRQLHPTLGNSALAAYEDGSRNGIEGGSSCGEKRGINKTDEMASKMALRFEP